MKIDKSVWKQKVQNLIDRRATGIRDNQKCDTIVSDYARHLRSFQLGSSVIDIGCGGQTIGRLLAERHPGVSYIGVDAFPIDGTDTVKMEIENTQQVDNFIRKNGQSDNVLCFAMLDGSYDLKRATANMKKMAKTSVVFLTGIDIEPDQYHTFKITKELLDELMLTKGWMIRMSNFLTPQVLLIEYARTGESEEEDGENKSGKPSATV